MRVLPKTKPIIIRIKTAVKIAHPIGPILIGTRMCGGMYRRMSKLAYRRMTVNKNDRAKATVKSKILLPPHISTVNL
ncbi:hypothetical protein DRO29_00655 [Candidatus Bathyarchaeota archaeon]|nr:MAG: hypothetical protein DRO29_00655 [Candidatus Bathyarchaeota archaeon]